MSHDGREDDRSHAEDRIEWQSRRRLLRRAALVGVGIALAPLLAACGGEGDDEDEGEEQEEDDD